MSPMNRIPLPHLIRIPVSDWLYSYPFFSESRAEQGSRVAFGGSVSCSFTLEHSLLFIFHAVDLLTVITTFPQEVPLSEFVSLLPYSVI